MPLYSSLDNKSEILSQKKKKESKRCLNLETSIRANGAAENSLAQHSRSLTGGFHDCHPRFTDGKLRFKDSGHFRACLGGSEASRLLTHPLTHSQMWIETYVLGPGLGTVKLLRYE